MYIIITTLVSLVKIENTIQYKEKLKFVIKHDIIPKKWVVRVIFKYYSVAKKTLRIILVQSQMNTKMIQAVTGSE